MLPNIHTSMGVFYVFNLLFLEIIMFSVMMIIFYLLLQR